MGSGVVVGGGLVGGGFVGSGSAMRCSDEGGIRDPRREEWGRGEGWEFRELLGVPGGVEKDLELII